MPTRACKWRFATPSRENARRWWARLPRARDELAMAEAESYERFEEALRQALVTVEFNFGLGRVDMRGFVHLFVWSQDFLRCENAIREALATIGERLHIGRFRCIIPRRSRGLRKLVGRLGFRHESYTSACYDGVTLVPAEVFTKEVNYGRSEKPQ